MTLVTSFGALTGTAAAQDAPQWDDYGPRVEFVPTVMTDKGQVYSICWTATFRGVEYGGEVIGQFTRSLPLEWLDDIKKIAYERALMALREICIQ